jgi:hypothetical protein
MKCFSNNRSQWPTNIALLLALLTASGVEAAGSLAASQGQLTGPGHGHYYRVDGYPRVEFDHDVFVDRILAYGEVDPADGSVDFGVALGWIHESVTPNGIHQPLTAVQRYATEFEPSAAYIEKIGDRHFLFVAGLDANDKVVAVRYKMGQPSVVWLDLPGGGQQARAIVPGAVTGMTRLLPASAGLVQPYFAIWPSLDPAAPNAFYGVKLGSDPANGDDFVVEYVKQQGAATSVVAGTEAPIVDWFTSVAPLLNGSGVKVGYRASLNPFLLKMGVSEHAFWNIEDADGNAVLDTFSHN